MVEKGQQDPSEDKKQPDEEKRAQDRSGDNNRRLDREGGQQGDEGDDESESEDEQNKGDDDERPVYKRPVFWIVAGVIAALLIAGGILWWLHARKYVTTDDAFVDAHIVRLSAQTSGKLVRVPDFDNRHVKQGQLLAVIEPGTPAVQLEEARAGVAQADAQIQQAQAKVITALATVRQQAANAIVPAAQAAHSAADYRRYVALQRLDPAAPAATQIEQARTTAESNEAQALAARRQVDSARADLAAARKDVKAAQAQREAALARVREAEVVTSYLRIVAPVAGQVVNRQVNVGSYVAPGQQLMAMVPENMWITANFKETQLKRMRPGQHVTIKIDAYPDAEFQGHVDSVQNGAGQAFQLLPPQNATGNYVKVVQRVPVRILFDGAEWRRYAIGPGMSVVPRVQVR